MAAGVVTSLGVYGVRGWMGTGTVREPIGEHEAAEILGVSADRVRKLEAQRSAGGRDDFPAPVVRLIGGPLWERAVMERYAENRSRKSGPPPGSVRPPRALARLLADGGVEVEDLRRVIRSPASGLTERERQVIELRLGQGQDGHTKPMSLRAVAAELGVSVPRVSQAQRAAVEKVLVALEPFVERRSKPHEKPSG